MRGILCRTIYDHFCNLWCKNDKKEENKTKKRFERLPIKWVILSKIDKKVSK